MAFPAGCYPRSQKPLSVPFVGPLDAYATGALEFHSIYQRLLASFTEALFEVRRSSDDETLWIEPLANGLFDSATLLSFCGAGDGYVTQVAGQLNGYNLVQPLAALQRRIVTAGVLETFADGTPSMRATSADTQGYYTEAFSSQSSSSASLFSIASITGGSTGVPGIGGIVTDSGWDWWGNALGICQQATNERVQYGQAGAAIDITFSDKLSLCAAFDGAHISLRNGGTVVSEAYTNGLSSVQRILAAGCRSVGYYYSGSSDGWQASAAYLSANTGNQQAIMAALEGML